MELLLTGYKRWHSSREMTFQLEVNTQLHDLARLSPKDIESIATSEQPTKKALDTICGEDGRVLEALHWMTLLKSGLQTLNEGQRKVVMSVVGAVETRAGRYDGGVAQEPSEG